VNIYDTQMLLKRARELATALPRDNRLDSLLEEIQQMEEALRQLHPFAELMSGLPFNPFAEDD
jgi:hypothetical protein